MVHDNHNADTDDQHEHDKDNTVADVAGVGSNLKKISTKLKQH